MKSLSKAALILIVLAALISTIPLHAQQEVTEQDAIDTAAAQPIFADALAHYDTWSAAAYNSHNAYGIWRVQFWDGDGNEIAWADVNPQSGRVYAYEQHFYPSQDEIDAAYDVLRVFINQAPEVVALVDDPSQYDIGVDYDVWNHWWWVYVNIGADSISAAVRFDSQSASDLNNPHVVSIYFPNLPSYAEWQESVKAEAINLAFQNADIANAVNGHTWTTTVERDDQGDWIVTFQEGDTWLAEATVDAALTTVVNINTSG